MTGAGAARPEGPRTDRMHAYEGFGGSVGKTFASSESWWPPRPTAPEGAPNVVVVLVDDLGFADTGCYGSEIDTPNIDALAARGVRLTNFHSTPMCSPTRSALLTGLNSHRAGVGTVAHFDPGFPGYAAELTDDAATLAEILRANGYATLMVGKWHLAKDADVNAAGNQQSWPCQRGFDRFYGILDAFTNLHHPHRLVEDNHMVEVDAYPDGYYFTDDITDRAISMIRERKASNPAKPFFLYFAHGAVHAPLHAKPDDMAKYRGRYDAGWDRLREERFARQQELGIVGPDTRLAPRNDEPNNEVQAWDDLPAREQELFARHMEVFAGMVDSVDQSLGRLVEAIDELGELDNTIILFTSDNGASREGELRGTSSYYVHLLSGDDVDADIERIDLIGGPQTTPHYPRGWAMAGNTPFRLYKINTHAGGHSVPCVVSWPRALGDGGTLRDQYGHVTDVLPTVLDAIGIERPASWNGKESPPLVGTSMLPFLREADRPTDHHEQLFEMHGHRGYYRDGWEVVTLHQPNTAFTDEEWELYDLTRDRTELDDRSADEPERRRELAAAWDAIAWRDGVFPLDEGSGLQRIIRPPDAEVFGRPVRIVAGTPTLERWRSLQLLWLRGATVDVRFASAAGDQGILLAHGDQGGGYALYVLDDQVVFVHNDGRGHLTTVEGGPLTPGEHELRCEITAQAARTWDVALTLDGDARGSTTGLPMLFGMTPFEGIDVGIDRRSPVSWSLYERFGPFPYSGRLRDVTYTPGPTAPDIPEDLVGVLRSLALAYE